METNVKNTAMPSVAGILSIVSGVLKLLWFLVLIIVSIFMAVPERFTRINPVVILVTISLVLIVLGVLAIVGGVYTLQRKNFGLSLAGAIAALLPFNLLCLAAVILLALSRKEFAD